jgi:hypothetical protein
LSGFTELPLQSHVGTRITLPAPELLGERLWMPSARRKLIRSARISCATGVEPGGKYGRSLFPSS